MKDYIVRLKEEKEELDEKMHKLSKFTLSPLFDDVDEEQKGLLCIQVDIMRAYLAVLEQRLILIEEREKDASNNS